MAKLTQTYEPEADLTALVDHPDNPRRGSDSAVDESVAAFGFYGAVLVQASTGRILAGHTRRRVLLARGQTVGPVIRLDCDDVTAKRILLADNRTAELASWDERALLDILTELGQTDEGALLMGTGYDYSELEKLATGLELPGVPDSLVTNPSREAERDYRKERYENTEMRQVMLVMHREEYEKLVLALEKFRSEWGLTTFAAVVQRLVEGAVAAHALHADDGLEQLAQ